MTRPVQSCARNIDQCSPADREIHGALSENQRKHGGTGIAKSVTPNRETRVALKQREDGAVGGGKQFAGKIREHVVENKYKEDPTVQFIESMLEKFGGLAGKVLSGVKNVSEFHKLATDWARETGKKQDEALQSDAMNLLVIDLVQKELPQAFVESARAQRSQTQTKELYAGLVQQFGNLPAERIQAVRQEVVASVKAGIAAAKSEAINTLEQLEQERKTNPEFARRFESETAFRLGVHAVIFQAKK